MPTAAWSDISLGDIILKEENKRLEAKIGGSITAASLTRSALQASTLSITVYDPQQRILNSGLLANLFRVNIDGHIFEIVKVEKQGVDLVLTFQDWAVALLQKNSVPMKAARAKITRAQFVNRMVEEEPRVSLFAPELLVKQAIATTKNNKKAQQKIDDSQKKKGFAAKIPADIKIKGTKADAEQLGNVNIALQVAGTIAGMTDQFKVWMIAVGIDESTWHNYSGGDASSVGVFQQQNFAPWNALDRHDVAQATQMFCTQLIKYNKQDGPGITFLQMVKGVQNPRADLVAGYANYLDEAKKIFNFWSGQDEFPVVEGGADVGPKGQPLLPYEFHRGGPGHRNETTWGAVVRLAQEVNWWAFTVGMTLYFISSPDLYTSRPLGTYDDNSLGIEDISFDFDMGKELTHGTITAHAGRWQVDPGGVIILENCGPANGRWLVTEIDRSLFDTEATITLQKPTRPLPEPAQQSGAKVVKANKLVTDGLLSGETVVNVARGFNGGSYRMGANHPGITLADLQNGKSESAPFDCSSLVYYCWLVGGHVEIGGGDTGGMIQWAKQTKANVWLQGTTKPSGGWKAGDVIFPTVEKGEHVCLATGNGAQTIAARQPSTGIGYDNDQPDTCFFFFRPIPG